MVFYFLPQYTQVVLLSATVSAGVLEVTERFMRDPIGISHKPGAGVDFDLKLQAGFLLILLARN